MWREISILTVTGAVKLNILNYCIGYSSEVSFYTFLSTVYGIGKYGTRYRTGTCHVGIVVPGSFLIIPFRTLVPAFSSHTLFVEYVVEVRYRVYRSYGTYLRLILSL